MAAALLRSLLAAATGWSAEEMPPLPDADDATGHTTLTQGGAPYELSVSVGKAVGKGGGKGVAPPAPLRYVLDLGTAAPDPAARLAAQRVGIDTWAARLRADERDRADGAGAPDLSGASALGELVDVAFGEPASVLSAAEFITWLGVVHHPTEPRRIAALKVYVCVEASAGALGRLAERWPTVDRLARLFPPDLARPFSLSVTVRAGPGAGPTVTLYRPVTPGYEHQALETAAFTLGATGVGRALRDLGLESLVWHGPMVLTTRCRLDPAGVDGGPAGTAGAFGACGACGALDGLRFGVDLSAAAFPADALPWARRATGAVHGSDEAVDRLVHLASVPAGRPWAVTWIGVEGTADAPIDRLSVYLAPRRVT